MGLMSRSVFASHFLPTVSVSLVTVSFKHDHYRSLSFPDLDEVVFTTQTMIFLIWVNNVQTMYFDVCFGFSEF